MRGGIRPSNLSTQTPQMPGLIHLVGKLGIYSKNECPHMRFRFHVEINLVAAIGSINTVVVASRHAVDDLHVNIPSFIQI